MDSFTTAAYIKVNLCDKIFFEQKERGNKEKCKSLIEWWIVWHNNDFMSLVG